MNKRVEIAGILGAGKTTLLKKIDTKNKNIICIYEDLSSVREIWNLIEADKNRSHYFLLISSYYLESTRGIINGISKNNKIIITDYSLSVHHYVYAYYSWKNGFINDTEWHILIKIFSFYLNILPPLAAVIEIDTVPSMALDNLKVRNRSLDKDTPISYLENIYKYFQLQKNVIKKGVPSIILTPEEVMVYSNLTQQKLKLLFSNI